MRQLIPLFQQFCYGGVWCNAASGGQTASFEEVKNTKHMLATMLFHLCNNVGNVYHFNVDLVGRSGMPQSSHVAGGGSVLIQDVHGMLGSALAKHFGTFIGPPQPTRCKIADFIVFHGAATFRDKAVRRRRAIAHTLIEQMVTRSKSPDIAVMCGMHIYWVCFA